MVDLGLAWTRRHLTAEEATELAEQAAADHRRHREGVYPLENRPWKSVFDREVLAYGDDDFAEEKPQESPEEIVGRMRVPRHFSRAAIDTWTPATGAPREVARWYVLNYEDMPLLFLGGEKGAGKTHLAIGIIREIALMYGKWSIFLPVIDLLDRYRSTQDRDRATETVEQIDMIFRRAAVVVLDDLGTERATDFAMERLFRLVDERYRENKGLIVTSNVDLADLDQRVARRFLDSSSATVVRF